MRWLAQLVTSPGGTVMDPFAGSSTTLLAARDEGMSRTGLSSTSRMPACRRRGYEREQFEAGLCAGAEPLRRLADEAAAGLQQPVTVPTSLRAVSTGTPAPETSRSPTGAERRDRYAAAICAAEGHDWEEIKASYPDDAAEYLGMADAALVVADGEQEDLIARLGEYADRAITNGQEASHWRAELDPARAEAPGDRADTEAYPTEVSYIGEIQEIGDLWGYLVADRDRTVVEKRLTRQRERFPTWSDGAPVRTRTVTKTTTYTLDAPVGPAAREEPRP